MSRLPGTSSLPLVVSGFGLLLSGGLAAWLHLTMESQAQERLDLRADALHGAMRGALLALDTTVSAAAGFLDVPEPMTRERFERFVASIDARHIDPSAQAVWYAVRTGAASRQAKADVEPAVASTTESWQVPLVEPVNGTESRSGPDVSGSTGIAALLEHAARAGEATTVGAGIVSGPAAGAGAQLLVMRSVGPTAEDAAPGVAAITVSLDRLLSRLAGPEALPDVLVTLSVRGLAAASPARELSIHNLDPSRAGLAGTRFPFLQLSRERMLPFGDAVLVLRCDALDSFVPAGARLAPVVALLPGLVIAGLLFLYTRRRADTQESTDESHASDVEDLYNNAPCGYHSLDAQGTIVRINDTELKWLGYRRDEIVGRKQFPELLSEKSRALFERVFPVFRERGSVSEIEFELLRSDGSTLPALLSATAVKDADGRFLYSRTTVFDISERRRADDAVLRSRDELREANAVLLRAARMKDEFLANMSHELRTPLNAVLLLAESLDEGIYGPVTAAQRKALRDVLDSGSHLLGLINDVLDLAKIGAGRMELDLESVEVEKLCETAVRMVREAAVQRQHRVETDVTPRGAVVRADPRRMRQILVNLLGNAIKFTAPGGHIRLEARGDPTSRRITFTVRDDGPGIADEEQAELFQPFVQIDGGLARRHEGTGLGLALVARLTDLHGGSVSVESKPGKGSAFSLTIPWQSADAAASASPVTPAAVNASNAVIVADSEIAAGRLALQLEELGVQSRVVSDAAAVHETVLALHPDLVMLDLMLPEPLGWDVLAKLKADARTTRIPVIITSVLEAQARSRTLGAEGYLIKPFDREDLRAVLIRIGVVPPLEHGAVVSAARERHRPAPVRALRVLVAEDNPVSREALSAWLRSRNIEVDTASNGAEALAAAARQRPDLVLMDVQMPGMDGLEATRCLRADPALRMIPVIALTALAMPGDEARCLAAGMDAYAAKPVSHAVLEAELECFLGPLRPQPGSAP